jgi:predicted tellurium resistance membrane protein TerC
MSSLLIALTLWLLAIPISVLVRRLYQRRRLPRRVRIFGLFLAILLAVFMLIPFGTKFGFLTSIPLSLLVFSLWMWNTHRLWEDHRASRAQLARLFNANPEMHRGFQRGRLLGPMMRMNRKIEDRWARGDYRDFSQGSKRE